MANPKEVNQENWMKELREREEKRRVDNPVIDERWWVVDYWPEERYSDEYSDSNWREAREKVASGYFKSRDEAVEFIENHNPEPRAMLLIRHQNKRRITKEEWVNW